MEKEYILVEDIIALAQVTLNDFPINGKFLITSVVEKSTKYNTPYLNINLKDKTGEIRAKRFTRGLTEFKSIKLIYLEGNVVETEGIYQNEWDSVKINHERLLESYEYDTNDYEESSDINVDKLTSTLMNTIDLIENNYLKNLLTLIFGDNDIWQAYFECPASVGMHHSYTHGNLEHTVSMIRIFQAVEENYGNTYNLDSDLVYTGIILHDIGKIKEYSIKNGIPMRNHGYGLIGHFSLGEEIVLNFIRQIEDFPEDLEWKLRHLILSHHGRKEYGSPIEPQIPEAEILHFLDLLDAKYKERN